MVRPYVIVFVLSLRVWGSEQNAEQNLIYIDTNARPRLYWRLCMHDLGYGRLLYLLGERGWVLGPIQTAAEARRALSLWNNINLYQPT